MDSKRLIILRCCRDWPCHADYAYGTRGVCGICKQVPKVIDEPYPIKNLQNYDQNQ
jgi:hypothetical protein